MSTTIMNPGGNTNTDAHREWATRPADERFSDLTSVYHDARQSRLMSREEQFDLGDHRDVSLLVNEAADGLDLTRETPLRTTGLMPYALEQVCSRLEVDRRLLPKLTPETTDNVLRDLQRRIGSAPVKGLFAGDSLRSISSLKYERLWDDEVVGRIMEVLPAGWHNPRGYKDGQWGAEIVPGGLYRGDRSMFLTLVDGGERGLEVGPRAKLHHGVMLQNSEHAGVSTFRFTALLFNEVCANNIFWGVSEEVTVRARHMNGAAQTALDIACGWFEGGARMTSEHLADKVALSQMFYSTFKALPVVPVEEVPALVVSGDGAEAIGQMRARGFSAGETIGAIATMMREETDSALVGKLGTPWDWMQGYTGHARSFANADARTDLEVRAAKLLVKA